MNCNKKSHFDGVTLVHENEEEKEEEGARFGYVSVCKEEVLSQAWKKEWKKAGRKWEEKQEVRKKDCTCRRQKKKSSGRGSERRGLRPDVVSAASQQLLMKHFGSISDSSRTA